MIVTIWGRGRRRVGRAVLSDRPPPAHATMNVLSAPSLLWNLYIDYLWNYQQGSGEPQVNCLFQAMLGNFPILPPTPLTQSSAFGQFQPVTFQFVPVPEQAIASKQLTFVLGCGSANSPAFVVVDNISVTKQDKISESQCIAA